MPESDAFITIALVDEPASDDYEAFQGAHVEISLVTKGGDGEAITVAVAKVLPESFTHALCTGEPAEATVLYRA